jgi:hypothetical protein
MSYDDYIRNKKTPRRKFLHPFAQFEHRIIDSEAFADLSGSAVRLMVLLLRQIGPGSNNGHLQATWSYCKKRGFNSQNTLASAIKELIAHGFLYRSRSRGPNKQWARYALTWLPLTKDTEKLFLQGFMRDAWRDWKKHPLKTEGKTLQKLRSDIKCSPQTERTRLSKTEDYEYLPSTSYQ